MTTNQISSKEEQVLLGSLLGDGSLSRPKTKNANSRYQEDKKLLHKDYLVWKSNQMPSLKLNVTTYKRFKKDYKNPEYYYCNAQGCALMKLTELRKEFYPEGKKIVTQKILDKLTPLAWVVWYCDDGCYSYDGNFIKICIEGFSADERKLIKTYFTQKRIACNIGKDGSLYLSVEGTKIFLEMIKSCFPMDVGMNYKLGTLLEENKTKSIFAKSKQAQRFKARYIRERKNILNHYHTNYANNLEYRTKKRDYDKQNYRKQKEKILATHLSYKCTTCE